MSDNDTDIEDEVEEEENTPENDKNDLSIMGWNFFSSVDYKRSFVLLLWVILVMSDTFTKYFIEYFDETTDTTGVLNTKGTMIQIFIIIVGFMIIDLGVKGEII